MIAERHELNEKLKKLHKFIYDKSLFEDIERKEQNLLIKQYDLMKQYSEVLDKRIAAFED